MLPGYVQSIHIRGVQGLEYVGVRGVNILFGSTSRLQKSLHAVLALWRHVRMVHELCKLVRAVGFGTPMSLVF